MKKYSHLEKDKMVYLDADSSVMDLKTGKMHLVSQGIVIKTFDIPLGNWQDLWDKQKSHDYEKCNICPESHHQSWVCRCEDRNIRIAKERRLYGKYPWFDL